MGCDPIAGMAEIAMDEKQDIALRAQMYRELATYIVPKRKAIEMSGPDNSTLTLADLVAGSYALEKATESDAKALPYSAQTSPGDSTRKRAGGTPAAASELPSAKRGASIGSSVN
jgi:hypothetical protein